MTYPTPSELGGIGEKAQSGFDMNKAIVSSAPARDAVNTSQTYMSQNQPQISPTASEQTYTVKAGDTISGIASQYGVNAKEITGYKSGDPNVIYPGEVLNLGGQQGSGGVNTAQQVSPPPIQATTQNQVLSGAVNQVNDLIKQYQAQGGQLSPEIQNQINAINKTANDEIIAFNRANTAFRSEDYQNGVGYVEELKKIQKDRDTLLNDFLASIQPLRDEYLNTMRRSEAETSIATQIADLQQQAQKSMIAIEGQAIPMGFISGQQREQIKLFQAEEANLLAKLGLAQDARKLESDILANKIQFAMDDYGMREKVLDRLQSDEDRLYEIAQNLGTTQRTFLADVAEQFLMIDIDAKENAQVKSQLIGIAQQKQIDPELMLNIIRNANNKWTADQTLKWAQESRLGGGGKTGASTDYYVSQIESGALDLTGVPSDSRDAVAAKLQKNATTLRDYSDDEIKSAILEGKQGGVPLEQIVSQINQDQTIKNKDRAIELASEEYGVAKPVYGTGNLSNKSLDDRIAQLKKLGWGGDDLRLQLQKDGYPVNEIKAKTDTWIDKIEGFLFGNLK